MQLMQDSYTFGNLEQSMDLIGQQLDLPDGDWLTFGTLNGEDCASRARI